MSAVAKVSPFTASISRVTSPVISSYQPQEPPTMDLDNSLHEVDIEEAYDDDWTVGRPGRVGGLRTRVQGLGVGV